MERPPLCSAAAAQKAVHILFCALARHRVLSIAVPRPSVPAFNRFFYPSTDPPMHQLNHPSFIDRHWRFSSTSRLAWQPVRIDICIDPYRHRQFTSQSQKRLHQRSKTTPKTWIKISMSMSRSVYIDISVSTAISINTNTGIVINIQHGQR